MKIAELFSASKRAFRISLFMGSFSLTGAIFVFVLGVNAAYELGEPQRQQEDALWQAATCAAPALVGEASTLGNLGQAGVLSSIVFRARELHPGRAVTARDVCRAVWAEHWNPKLHRMIPNYSSLLPEKLEAQRRKPGYQAALRKSEELAVRLLKSGVDFLPPGHTYIHSFADKGKVHNWSRDNHGIFCDYMVAHLPAKMEYCTKT